jgi:hypothetical protein
MPIDSIADDRFAESAVASYFAVRAAGRCGVEIAEIAAVPLHM